MPLASLSSPVQQWKNYLCRWTFCPRLQLPPSSLYLHHRSFPFNRGAWLLPFTFCLHHCSFFNCRAQSPPFSLYLYSSFIASFSLVSLPVCFFFCFPLARQLLFNFLLTRAVSFSACISFSICFCSFSPYFSHMHRAVITVFPVPCQVSITYPQCFRLGGPHSCSGPCFGPRPIWSMDCTYRIHLAQWHDVPFWDANFVSRMVESASFLHFWRRLEPFCCSVWAYASRWKMKIMICMMSGLRVYKDYKY